MVSFPRDSAREGFEEEEMRRYAMLLALATALLLAACTSGGATVATPTQPAPYPAPSSTDTGTASSTPDELSQQDDPFQQLDTTNEPALQGATGPSSASLASNASGQTFEQFLEFVINDVATYWQGRLAEWAPQYGTPQWQGITYVLLDRGERQESRCLNATTGQFGWAGNPDSSDQTLNPAFWCSKDSTMYLSMDWSYDNIWAKHIDIDPEASDFGVAFVIAHELGHAVQTMLGITTPSLSMTVAPIELQADCLAGIWANAKYYQGALDANDVQQGVQTAEDVGDFDYFNREHHGDPQQRASAFMVGYNSGNPGDCTLDLEGSF
jgi:predicted metalloprotease